MKREYLAHTEITDEPGTFWDLLKWLLIGLAFVIILFISLYNIDHQKQLDVQRHDNLINLYKNKGYIINKEPVIYDIHCRKSRIKLK